MRINVFEGARRIAKLIALIWVLGVCTYSIFDLKAQSSNDITAHADERILTEEEWKARRNQNANPIPPGKLSFEEWKARRNQNANSISAAQAAEPWTEEELQKELLMQNKQQQSNQNPWTEEELLKELAIQNKQPEQPPLQYGNQEGLGPNPVEMAVNYEWWQKNRQTITDGVIWLFSGLVFIWALTWAIGWIVRGFFGISSGQDFKQ